MNFEGIRIGLGVVEANESNINGDPSNVAVEIVDMRINDRRDVAEQLDRVSFVVCTLGVLDAMFWLLDFSTNLAN